VKRDEVSWQLTKRLYLEGFSLREVAELAHVSPTVVRWRLQKQGVALRPPGAAGGGGPRLPAREIERTVLLYVDLDMSAYEVGQALGISHSTVMYRLRKAGIKPRDRREQGLLAWRNRQRRAAV
jgi:DNA-directed RNA polymerase specialized sigma24 family protein